MTNPDYRALCAELHEALEKRCETLEEDRLLDRSAAALRAALAQPVGAPMTDPDLRALCAKLADAYEHELNKRGMGCELINSARALLDQPVADGELVEWLRESLDCALQSGNSESIKHHCQLLNVLGHPTPQPVAKRPPSLKEQALLALAHLDKGAQPHMDTTEASDTIRRALEALDD
jgi:hypothetical protein